MSCFSWSPSEGSPSSPVTSLISVATSNYARLTASLSNGLQSLEAATASVQVASLSRVICGAQASLALISAEKVLATETNAAARAEATTVLAEASYVLAELTKRVNLYGYELSRGGNYFYLVFFGLLLVFYLAMTVRSRYDWFNVCFICGFGLEFVGFLGRVLSFHSTSSVCLYVLESFGVIVAPAFIMTGVYFVFTQVVIIHGHRYSVLRPMWYPYIFITMYVVTLVLQGVGGGIFGMAKDGHKYPRLANLLTFAGMVVLLAAMCILLCFVSTFVHRIFFYDRDKIQLASNYKNCTFVNFLKLLLNVPSARDYKYTQLERFYNPRYQGIRLRRLFAYYPLAILVSVLAVFIRCMYRAVEIKQGYLGELLRNENYFLIFDSAFVAICGLVFIPFHPLFVFGKENVLSVVNIKHDDNYAIEEIEDKSLESPRINYAYPSSDSVKKKDIQPLYMF